MKTNKLLLITMCFVLCCFLLTQGCQINKKVDANDEANADRIKAIAFPVEATFPTRKDINKFFETTTRVSAEKKVDVISKGLGICEELIVEEGDYVKEGQLLAKLDTSEVETQILQTLVNIKKCKAALEIAENSLKEGIGSKVERDNARFALDAAEATLKIQQLQLKNQTIVAPISGIITKKNIQKGVLVSTGMPVFSIVDPESYVLPINIPEREISNVSINQESEVIIDSCPEDKFTAAVFRISPTIDPNSGTIKTTLHFIKDNNKKDECIKDSAFARVKLVMETHPQALVIPKDAVLEESGKKYVYVAKTKEDLAVDKIKYEEVKSKEIQFTAERVEVKVGLEDSSYYEILDGIDEHTLVITLGQMNLRPGSVIEITSLENILNSSSNISNT
ncbi:MAG TPA: efflux RND transporter periplasmic adaptor subunit [Candidatus Hydrogenedens sp.]|nr:efflux RND transporter periplasmic adaptor subunit [Candidatus Hydrogenedens sp.]